MLAHYATRFPNVEIDSTSYGLPTPRMAETRARVIATHVETIAYVRFHGRNYEQWWKGDNVTRYDYSYRDDELVPWVDRLVDLATHREVREALADLGGPERADVRSDARYSISAGNDRTRDRPPGRCRHAARTAALRSPDVGRGDRAS